ncbi:hypothetical protein ACN6KF_001451 [Labrys sp. La1]|uniref:hypothetical protein n=1 Tax=Labrys sp. La1 TaxID=3404917 RepID=UPI003EBABCEB
MPTLIDSLVVELGLDPSEFTKGQKKAAESFLKTKDEAVRSSKAIEESGRKAADGIKKIAVEALALFAIFTGTKSITKFVSDLMSADAALGRFSRTVGMAPQYVGAIGKVVGEVGGTAEATAGTIDGLSNSLTRFRTANGDLPQEFWQLRAMVGGKIDPRGSMVDFLDQLAAALQKVEKTDPQKAAMYARALSIDPGTYQLMLKYGQELSKVIGLRKDLAPSNQDIDNAQKFQEAWNNIYQSVRNLIEKGVRAIEPALTPVVNKMTEWVQANKEMLSDKIVEYAKGFVAVLKSIAENADLAVRAIEELNRLTGQTPAAKDGTANDGRDEAHAATSRDAVQDGGYWRDSTGVYKKGSFFRDRADYAYGNIMGGRATGGSVTGGQAYMVGERGPEPFIPNTTGTIIPHDRLGGNLSVDGRPINRGNPMPVTLANNQGGGENWLQTLGKWLGFGGNSGSSAGSGATSGGGGFFGAVGKAVKGVLGGSSSDAGYSPASGKPGQYRPVYKLGDADLSDDVVNVVNGEATSSKLSTDAVINNMFNRLGTRAYGPSGNLRQVARAPGQYAGYRKATAERAAFIRDRIRAIASGEVPDVTTGANEYRASWYNGPWGRKHASSPVIGGNRFAYNPKVAPGPYAPYARPNLGLAGGDGVLSGAKGAAIAGGSTTNDNRKTSTSSSSSSTTIGKIEIHTQAKDANGIAASLHDSIRRNATASAANNGPN